MDKNDLLPHLFRTEFGKITAVLSKWLGISNLETAEDITSETFLAASEVWPYQGVPPNPRAWLYAVAKNKAKNHLSREHLFKSKIGPELNRAWSESSAGDPDMSDKNITDSQLQMLFAICDPRIGQEAQIGLALRILCGFGIDEIADAFLTNKETINKRLFRAKEKLRATNTIFAFPEKEEVAKRLETVAKTLYLLFNEGYYAERQEFVLREELCLEAMRLTYMLIENEDTSLPPVKALFSLMCFHASRFAARRDQHGAIVLYEDQDESLWNQELIQKGLYYFNASSEGDFVSQYHLEAGIAFWHTQKEDTEKKWQNILYLYDHLLTVAPSAVAALNRIFAYSKVHGAREAVVELEKQAVEKNRFYHVLMGKLFCDFNKEKAKANFEIAYQQAETQADKKVIEKHLKQLE